MNSHNTHIFIQIKTKREDFFFFFSLCSFLFTLTHIMKSLFGLALVFYSASTALALQSYCQPGYKPIAGKDLKLDLGALNK